MTSLARQLERLAVPYTQSLLGQDTRRASLLFDPKEAANLDKEAVFALALSGLEALETIDPAFVEFEATLFNSASYNWERSLQTKEINDQLDETISQFLVQLSPYFLLRAAHKTLEWLIYKYHIHQFNIDSLLLCVLPYHETKIFVRVVQLLPITQPTNKWNWIHKAASAGVPLARQTLVNHCRGDPGFFAFICEIVPKFIKCHGTDSKQLRAVIALFTCTMLGALQREEEINERLLSVVVPHLIRGFKSRCVEYRAACCMVLSQLASVARLKESLLVSLLPVVTKRMPSGLAVEVLSCLAVICQTQTLKSLPKKSFKHICRTPGIVQLLTNMSHKYRVNPLLRLWFDCLILAAVELRGGATYSSSEGSEGFGQIKPDYPNQLQLALAEIAIDDNLAKYLARSLMENLLECRQKLTPHDDEMVSRWQQLARHVLTTVEHRHSAALEMALEETLAKHHADSALLSVLQEMMALTSVPLKYQLLPESGTCLLIGLSHAQPSMRLLALQQLNRSFHDNQEVPGDFLEDVLLARLADDSLYVATAALLLGQKLPEIIEKKKLLDCLLGVVGARHGLPKWKPVTTAALEIICSPAMGTVIPDLGLTLLPYLLITGGNDAAEIEDAKTILQSAGVGRDKLLQRVGPAWLREVSNMADKPSLELISRLNCVLVHGLVGVISERNSNMLSQWMSMVLNENVRSNRSTFLLICALAELLRSNALRARSKSRNKTEKQVDYVETSSRLLSVLTVLCDTKKQTTRVDIAIPDSSLEELLGQCLPAVSPTDAVPLSLQKWGVDKVVSAVKSFRFKADGGMWLSVDDSVSVVVTLLDLLMTRACVDSATDNPWRQLMHRLVMDNLDEAMLDRLFPYLWTSDVSHNGPGDDRLSPQVSALVQVGSFYLMASRWQQLSGSVGGALQEDCAVIPSLLVSLRSQQVAVRRGALRCLQVIRQHCRHDDNIFASVIKRLVTQEEEILADHRHMTQVIGKIYSKLNKPGRQKGLQQFLQWTTSADTPADMKERLLELLSDVPHQHVLSSVLPLGLDLLDTSTSQLTNSHLNILQLILIRFDNNTACDLHEGHPSLTFLEKAMAMEKGVTGSDTPQCMAVAQVTHEFFWALPDLGGQRRIVTCLLDVETTTKCSTVSAAVRRCLKQLKLNGEQIFHELPGEDSSEVATVKGKKRARVGKAAPPISYRRLTLLLEVMQSRKKVKDSENLVARLFVLLNRLLSQEAEEVEYCNQLILSCLLNMCTRWRQKPAQEESFNVEILVECIRSSSSPQTQRQALLLMASVAHLLPEYILHNVMSIFTFMGSNLLQQDDSYSFHVITMTMQTIIPALIKAHEGDHSGTLSDQIAGILRVFVDARHHVPKHRSQLLFRQLIDTINPQRHLWMVMVLMMESAVRSKNIPTVSEDSIVNESQKGPSRIDQDIEFMAQICEQFPAANQMRACSHVMAFLQKLSHRNELGSRGREVEPLDLIHADTLSVQQLRQLQMHLTRLVAVLLSCESFATQILMTYAKKTETDPVDEFSGFVRECLCYLTAVTRNQGAVSGLDPAVVKFWKSVLHKVYDILDKVNYLLPTPVFLEVVSTLMQHSLVGIRRKALELLNRRLQQLQPSALSDTEVQSLLMLVEKLITMATTGKLVTVATTGKRVTKATAGKMFGHDQEADIVTVQQLALFGLKLMCKVLGAQHPKAFAKVFDISIKILDESSTDIPSHPPPMTASALLCLAELCTTTKAHAIPYLSRFMPPLIATLNNRALLMGHELVLICALTALHRITSSLPHFLSPYLIDIILAVCHISSLVSTGDKTKKSQANIRLSGVRHQMACTVSPRVLVPALSECYTRLLADNQDGVQLLLEILCESIEAMNKDDLAAQHTPLVTLFCRVLDLSNTPQLRLSWSETMQVESAAIDAVLAMVVRLSENSFRPMFYKLFDWACREESDEYNNRKLTFFRLAERLSERLKSLFNLFVGHIIKTATNLLEQNNILHADPTYFGHDEAGTRKSCTLLGYVMGCLHKCMLYDTDGFINSDIFKLLLQPLVDQLENFVGGDAAYEARMRDYVTPCISQLGVTTRDDSAWKSLNYQILLKTRHNLPKVRFAALKTIEDLAQKLGDEYMTLVPETIPFLAELMEDESEEVEQLCQQVIASMEDVLGESLQKYF